ncbi:MAG: hypothetical protein NT126_02290 [Bacteroidetes bacterium]|nr:hypothetical protein [Bacteroidota bacterium]
MKRNTVINTCIFLVTLFIGLVASEYAFRSMIFSKNKSFQKLRNPADYADDSNEDDYWKLYYLFGGQYKPPAHPHPLLGWIGDFNPATLAHNQLKELHDRRPVLLYGDSYAQCMSGVKCFQDILNSDSSFNKKNYLLNYGVGGYGVDQADLLLKNTVHHYKDPFVIFSLMVGDLDRSPLSVRTGQKPFYNIEHDSLVLHGVPVESNPEDFFRKNPPSIKSYMYRKFLFSKINFLPAKLTSRLKHEEQYIEKKIRLNEKILDDVIIELRKSNIDFIFVVFHYIQEGNPEYSVENENDWRDHSLRTYLEKNKIPFVWSKELIRKDPEYDGKNISRYMIVENGHPTAYFNELISQKMKYAVDEYHALRDEDESFYIRAIRSNSEWLTAVKQKAVQKNIPEEEMIIKDAVYTVREKRKEMKVKSSIAFYEKQIQREPVWFKEVQGKSMKNRITLAEQIRRDAEFMYRLQFPANDDSLLYVH